MKKLTRFITLVLSLLLFMPNMGYAAQTEVKDEPTVKAASDRGLIVAYFNASVGISSFEFSGIDVINYHPASIVANGMSYTGGNIITHNHSSRMSYYKQKALAQNPDIKFLFTVANGNINDFESWFYNSKNADRLVTEMINIIKTYGYDGLDIDYEFPQGGSNTRRYFVYFMQRMREELDKLGRSNGKEYYLSMAVPGGTWAFSLFDMVGLSEHVDYFNIMNYDLYVGSATAGTTHHHTAPYDDTLFPGGTAYSDIGLYRSYGIPDSKIVVGLGMYARRWTGVRNVNNGLHQPGTLDYSTNEAYIHYSVLRSSYENRNGYTKYWDDTSKAPWLYNPYSGIFLTYDDERSAKIKAEIAGQAGIRGLMVFDYCTTDGIGFFDNLRSWLDAASGPHEHSYTRTLTKLPGCVEEGIITYTCKCGHSYTESYPAVGTHAWNEWVVTKEPTETEEGERQRTCRRNCGAVETEVIPKLEPEVPEEPEIVEPYLTSEGVQLTVNGLHNVKDYFIAEGDHDTYRQVKDNMVVSIGAAKIGTNTSYTYMVKNHGIHTVYIRYNDGTAKVLKTEITGVEPEFKVNGLQLTVTNLENVKVIRTAYGDFDKVGQMKKAATHRGFTAKASIKGADEYMIQYRDNGTVTVAVVYNDGYEAFYTWEVQKKEPTVEQNGNTIVFGNLDGLYNIRYAKGEYKTSAQIKAAAGSVALKPSKIDENGNITVKLTTVGTYTFCVQYDDESYNYYTIIVECIEN